MPYRHNDVSDDGGVRFLMGLLVGTAIGAALGVLLAPKSGTEMRANLRSAAERGANAVRKATAACDDGAESERTPHT